MTITLLTVATKVQRKATAFEAVGKYGFSKAIDFMWRDTHVLRDQATENKRYEVLVFLKIVLRPEMVGVLVSAKNSRISCPKLQECLRKYET